MIPTLTSRVIGFEEGERGGVRVEKRLFRAVSPIFAPLLPPFYYRLSINILRQVHTFFRAGVSILERNYRDQNVYRSLAKYSRLFLISLSCELDL